MCMSMVRVKRQLRFGMGSFQCLSKLKTNVIMVPLKEYARMWSL